MSEPQYPQNPPPTPPSDPKPEPYGGPKPPPQQYDPQNPPQTPGDPKQEPYGGTKPPPKYEPPTPPETPETPPCPPKEECPKPKPCPDPPQQPPDPCDDKPADPGTYAATPGGTTPGGTTLGGTTPGGTTPGGTTPGYPRTPGGTTPGGGYAGTPGGTTPGGTNGGSYGGGATGGANGGTNGESPAAHLAALRKEFEEGQKKLQELEPLKSAVADIEQRILAFEKAVDDQSTLEATYKAFYKDAQTQLAEIDCSIPTLRCQIEISDKAKKCVCDAIALVDAKVAKAKKDRDDQVKLVEEREKAARRTTRELDWAKKWHDFLKKGLQEQVGKQRELLKTIKGKVTPKTDPCEAYFYVYELERLTKSLYDTKMACWVDTIWLATYIDCWPWENYKKAWNRALVAYNKADAADKLAKGQLEQAKKLLVELEKLVTESSTKRQEWILKEIKAADCCGPKSNCP